MWSSLYDLLMGDALPEERTRAWRLLVTVALTTHIVLACGWFPLVFAGFASVDSVTQLQKAVDSIQLKLLVDSIEVERRNACRHLADDNKQALDYAVRKRDELIREYEEITGRPVQLVTCAELGILLDETDDD